MLIIGGMGIGGPINFTCGLIEALKTCDFIYAEKYTNPEGLLTISEIEKITRKKVQLLNRKEIEDENGSVLLEKAINFNVAFLVFGDPFIFTTHISLKKKAQQLGIKTKVFHGISVFSLAPSCSGLDPYRFGPPVTLVFPDEKHGYFPETPYTLVQENLNRDLHTLVLMDVRADEERFMNFSDAFKIMEELENKIGGGIFIPGRKIILLAALGSEKEIVKWVEFGQKLSDLEYPLPRSMIIPASLKFYEV